MSAFEQPAASSGGGGVRWREPDLHERRCEQLGLGLGRAGRRDEDAA